MGGRLGLLGPESLTREQKHCSGASAGFKAEDLAAISPPGELGLMGWAGSGGLGGQVEELLFFPEAMSLR